MSNANQEKAGQLPGAAVGTFASHDFAEAAVKELADADFDIKKLSIIGRGFHTDEQIAGFYTSRDRVQFWGSNGAFWGGLWDLFFGGLFMTVPLVGPVIVVGHLATIVIATIEGAVVVGGISALGAALYSIGVPKESVLRYEKALKADGFLIIVHGDGAEIERARAILQNNHATQLDVFSGGKTDVSKLAALK